MVLATCTRTSVSSVCVLTFIDPKRSNNANLNAQEAYITIIKYITSVMLTIEKVNLHRL